MKPQYSPTVEEFIIRHYPKTNDQTGTKRAVLIKKVSKEFKVLSKTASQWVTRTIE